MRTLKWIHVAYVGFWSVFVLFTTALGLLRGTASTSNTTGLLMALHLIVAAIGIAIVLLCYLDKRVFSYLLILWWIPQLCQVTMSVRSPTYPQNMMTPLYLIALGPSVSIALIHELDIDKLLFLRLNVVAVIGLLLAHSTVLGRTWKSTRRSAESITTPNSKEISTPG